MGPFGTDLYNSKETIQKTLNIILRSILKSAFKKSYQISSDVFFRIVFKEFDVDVPHLDVGDDDLLADGGQSGRVLEQRLVLKAVGHGGQKLDRVRRQHVVLDLEQILIFIRKAEL